MWKIKWQKCSHGEGFWSEYGPRKGRNNAPNATQNSYQKMVPKIIEISLPRDHRHDSHSDRIQRIQSISICIQNTEHTEYQILQNSRIYSRENSQIPSKISHAHSPAGSRVGGFILCFSYNILRFVKECFYIVYIAILELATVNCALYVVYTLFYTLFTYCLHIFLYLPYF